MARQDWLMISALSLLWGGSFLFVEIALDGLPTLMIVWLRVMIAAFVLGGVLWFTGASLPPRRAVPMLFVMALLNNIIPFTLITVAQGQITGALASILNATTPLFAVVVAHVATADERITPLKAAGLGLGFLGVVVMMAGRGMGSSTLAQLCSLAGAFSYGCAAVYGRRFRAIGLPFLTTAFGQVSASALMLLPFMVFIDQPWRLAPPEPQVIAAILGLGILSTALAYAIYFRTLSRVGATNTSIVTFLVPISATVLGIVILHERLELQHIAGFALICLGLAAIDGRLAKRLGRSPARQ